MTRRTVTTTDVRAWEAAYDQGRTINAIAIDFGWGYHTIRTHLAPSGRLPSKGRGTGTTPTTKRVADLVAQGISSSAIAERTGVSLRRIYHLRWEMSASNTLQTKPPNPQALSLLDKKMAS
jgi:hypothetical protein